MLVFWWGVHGSLVVLVRVQMGRIVQPVTVKVLVVRGMKLHAQGLIILIQAFAKGKTTLMVELARGIPQLVQVKRMKAHVQQSRDALGTFQIA
jgi:hypothetical protein